MAARTDTQLAQRVAHAARHARHNGLIYVSDSEPGIERRRRGRSFSYVGPNGRPVTAAQVLERIRHLAIPPAYTDVWICRAPNGHLQATGRDARRRKQYRYHPDWRATRDDGKFARMIEFGRQLPALRRQLQRDLALPGLPKRKVLAAVTALLADTLLRVGNEEYVRANNSYGLTTLRDRHVRFLKDGRAFFCFRGKGGRRQERVLDDRRLAAIIRRCRELPGQLLFQYIDDDGRRQPVSSGLVNEYLREVMQTRGSGFTAKDFRTWGATLRAIAYLACVPVADPPSERAFTRCVAATARHVAETLGNTPAVCRKSYINPLVFTAWRSRALERLFPAGTAIGPRRLEKLALTLLRAQEREAHRSGRTRRP